MKSQIAVSNAVTRIQYLTIALTALFALATTACQPNDEKVSNRGGGFNSASGETDAKLGDRVTEYSRSMLIELADVARQAEFVLQASSIEIKVGENPFAVPPAKPSDAAPAVLAAPLQVARCKEIKVELVEPNAVKFATEISGCFEKGPTFEGKQYGREIASATLRKVEGQPNVATSITVEGIAIDTVLTPKANPKDSLRVETNRVLHARLISETATERLYEFVYTNHSPYNLNLKALTDGGQITSSVAGVLVYDVAERKVTSLREGLMSIRVESARLGRGGGRVVRQEFSSTGIVSGDSKALAIDLAACALPQGSVDMKFSVRPVLSREKEKVVESATVIDSFKDHVVNTKTDPAAPTAKVAAKLCSAAGQITMTEFYAGLLY